MLGAIVGDIVGSVYEWHNIKTKEFPLFRDDCFFTDDTVMTCAVAEAIMNGGERDDFIDAMKKYGRMYPDAGYGGRFGAWINSDNREPYNSYGNGSAMRVSPCAWMMDCGFCARTGMWPSNGRERVKTSAEVTHNHPEGIKGAMATADAIFYVPLLFWRLLRRLRAAHQRDPAERVQAAHQGTHRKRDGYDLPRHWMKSVLHIASTRTCQDTVPQAIIAFLEKARTLRMPSETPSHLVGTATPSRQSLAASQRRHTAFPTGLRTRAYSIWMSR
jgi:ADP-ribosylglycohydrolase